MVGCTGASTKTVDSEHEDHSAEGGEAFGAILVDPDDLQPADLDQGEKLRVVATTSIIADVLANVGGEDIEVTSLLAIDTDPHAYEPAPQDLKAISEAHVVMINGLGLEASLEGALTNAAGDVPFLSLSEEIEARTLGSDDDHLGGEDPHVWFDPLIVILWVDRAATAFSALDPAGTEDYQERSEEYQAQLGELDLWIQEQVGGLRQENRLLLTDHLVFGYFADRYGFEMLGAVIPTFSSATEPSAREIAELEEKISTFDVPAIFVGSTFSPVLANRVAEDTGVLLVPLFTGSLSEPEGPAGNYLDFMRYNVSAIVGALSQ